jgi:PilZ domain-containing protein
VPDPCTVIVGPTDTLPALKERAAAAGLAGEILSFSDSSTPVALETITKRKPGVIALERSFAATPRGAALITRLKADATLKDSEIRVIAHDSEAARVVPRPPIGGGPAGAAALDQRGTRRAPRFKMKGKVDATIDGKPVTVADLSTVGACVVSPTVLKPNQKIKMALTDDSGKIPFNADIAWSSFEIPPNSSPRYRVGVNFQDADAGEVEAFCGRHKA